MREFLFRCPSCHSLNRILSGKINEHPVCGSCKKNLVFPDSIFSSSAANFTRDVTDYPGYVLVDLWSPTCGYCHKLLPELEIIARERKGMLKVVKINVQEEQAIAQQFNIRGVPTMLLFNRGVKIDEIAGYLPKPQLDQWLDARLK